MSICRCYKIGFDSQVQVESSTPTGVASFAVEWFFCSVVACIHGL